MPCLHRTRIENCAMKPHISLSELYQMKRKKENNTRNYFNTVLQKCHSKIRTVAQQGGLNTFYEVPGMVIGLPLYDIKACTEYIIKQLRDSGFLVQLLPPPSVYVIYVSWDPEEIKPMKKSAPTLSAPEKPHVNKLRLF